MIGQREELECDTISMKLQLISQELGSQGDPSVLS